MGGGGRMGGGGGLRNGGYDTYYKFWIYCLSKVKLQYQMYASDTILNWIFTNKDTGHQILVIFSKNKRVVVIF